MTMNTQVQGAVQNTDTLSVDNTPQLAEIVNAKLDKDILRKSYEFADRAYDIQWGKDGIEDTQAKLEGLQGKVGEMVYAIAKLAYAHCSSVPGGKALIVARQYFMALCEQDEKHIMSRDVEKNGRELAISKLIPLWPQYKSSIAKGMEMGIDPMERDPDTVNGANPQGSLRYPTAAKYRAKVQEMEARERGANERDTDKPRDNKEVVTALTVVASGMSPNLQAAFRTMCEQLRRLPHGLQDQFAPKLLAIAGEAKAQADANMEEKKADADRLAAKLAEAREEVSPETQAALQAALDKEANKDDKAAAKESAKRGGRRVSAA